MLQRLPQQLHSRASLKKKQGGESDFRNMISKNLFMRPRARKPHDSVRWRSTAEQSIPLICATEPIMVVPGAEKEVCRLRYWGAEE